MLSKNNNTSNATLARNKRNSTGCATNGKEKLPKTILHQPQCPPPHSPNNNKLPETLATPQPFGDLVRAQITHQTGKMAPHLTTSKALKAKH